MKEKKELNCTVLKDIFKKKAILDTEIKTKQSKTTLAKHHASV